MATASYTTHGHTTVNSYEQIVSEPALPVSIKYLVATFCFLAGLAGSFGNILVILAIARTKKLRTSVNAFIASLAVADLCNCMLMLPLIALAFISLDIVIGDGPLCRLFYLISLTFSPVSIEHLTVIASNRYVLVNKSPKTYAKLFNRRTIPVMIAFLWGSNVVMNIFYSTSSYIEVKVRGQTYCAFQQRKPFNVGYSIFALLFSFTSSFIVIPALYLLTFRTVHRSRVRVTQEHSSTTQHTQSTAVNNLSIHSQGQTAGLPIAQQDVPTKQSSLKVAEISERLNNQPPEQSTGQRNKLSRKRLTSSEIRIIKVNFIIFLTNILFLLPLLIVLSATFGYLSHFQLILSLLPIGLNSAINPLVYCGFNRNFRQAFQAILRR